MPSVTIYLGKGDLEIVLQAREAWFFRHGDKPSLEILCKSLVNIGARYLIEDYKKREEAEKK